MAGLIIVSTSKIEFLDDDRVKDTVIEFLDDDIVKDTVMDITVY